MELAASDLDRALLHRNTTTLINQCSTDGAVMVVTTDRDRQIVNIANEMTFCCAFVIQNID